MIISPVIVVGCARSGTTLLYQLLSEVPELWSIGFESKAIIEHYHHPSVKGWSSGSLDASDLTEESHSFLTDAFIRQSAPGTYWRHVNAFRRRLANIPIYHSLKQYGRSNRAGSSLSSRTPQMGLNAFRFLAAFYGRQAEARFRSIRLLEKTPENCLRLPFLQALFPDMRVIFLTRDGRANIHSLMEGWRNSHYFPGYDVPAEVTIQGQVRGRWAFTLIPGWQDLVDRPLAEVCAYQWVRVNEAVLDYIAQPARRPVLVVRYEDLVDDPAEVLSRIGKFLKINPQSIPAFDNGLPEVNVITRPAQEKWRNLPVETMTLIKPIITPMMAQLGYHSDESIDPVDITSS
jgi:hypothetical protein